MYYICSMEIKEFKNSGIYIIYNIKNFECYIGSSANIGTRLTKHFSLLKNNKHANNILQEYYNKNKENISVGILEFCSEKILYEKEKYYYNKYKDKAILNIVDETGIKRIYPESMRKNMSESRKTGIKEGKIKVNCRKAISKYDLQGNFIKDYISVKEAAKSISNSINAKTLITNCCMGRSKTAKGFIFKYKEDPLTLKDIIFSWQYNYILKCTYNNKIIYFRNIAKLSEFFKIPSVTVSLSIRNSIKRNVYTNIVIHNKYSIDLVKSCELLENLEADNQQPSDIEIY